MLIKPKIIWEKWEDPFLAIEPLPEDEDNEEYPDFASAYQDEEESEPQDADALILYSSMGIIPYNEKIPSSKIFNFWVGHTNFDITNNVQQIISSVTGVEILDIFTRYRFRIAVAKAFKDRDVMNDISSAIQNAIEYPE